MYRGSRTLHRWIGLGASIFLVVIAVTGFFLANKSRFGWLRPPPAEAIAVTAASEVISIEQAVEAAFALGHPELQRFDQIDRVDYRPGDNIFKVISNDDYREVQVDGKTGKVLSSSFRSDQLMEDIHDMSFFADFAHDWLLPIVALGLGFLGLTGIVMFFTPVVRRWQFKRKGLPTKKP